MTEATKAAATKEHPAKKATTKTKTKKSSMVNKRSTSKTPTKTTTKKVEKGTRTLYYAYSVGCGWCKKTDPIIDELNADGWNIQKLDLAVPENQTVVNEVKQKYSHQCGTPYMVDADTGNMICGFREKDVLEKWANGEEIPAPPRPKSPPPRPPFNNATDDEVNTWRTEYDAWLKENDHLPDNQKRTADQILEMPRPNTQPPQPPVPTADDTALDAWGKEYEAWVKENSHLPNLQPVNTILERFKAQRDARLSKENPDGVRPMDRSNVGNPTGNKSTTPPSLTKDLNTEFYYIVENEKDVPVYADEAYIRALEHQYYIRETETGKLTKVVGDTSFNG